MALRIAASRCVLAYVCSPWLLRLEKTMFEGAPLPSSRLVSRQFRLAPEKSERYCCWL